MASTKEYRDYILEQLSLVPNVTCRPMMGEFLLYADGVLFGGIYDDRLLVKKTDGNAEFGMSEALPYEGTKKMYLVDEVDDRENLPEIIRITLEGLRKTDKINRAVRKYIETKILPQYSKLGGHTDEHVRYVINRSLQFYKQAPNLNINMVYTIAAYHDLGRLVDDETHNIESAKMIRADKFLAKHFSAEEIEIMAQAVEDHRASLGREPRSVYGKLVSSADRDINYETMLSRVYDYTKHLHPTMTESEILEEARVQLRKKYALGGYALKTMYFNDPDFNNTVQKVERATSSNELFNRIMQEHNRNRIKK